MMKSTSIIEIDKKKLKENYKFIEKMMGKRVIISSVIKGNAYGHGIEDFLPIAFECGKRHFSVFSADEAYRAYKTLRKCLKLEGNPKDSGTIMIMGMMDRSQVEWAIKNDVEFYVFDENRLIYALKIAKKLNKQALIHIEIETGMNRTGFNHKETRKVMSILEENREYLKLRGLCTHYAGAECIANYVRVNNQIKLFKKAYQEFCLKGLPPDLAHTACSAASVRYPATRMDMVRIGIMQYGYWPNMETLITYLTNRKRPVNPLNRIITWKSKVMSVKDIKTGDFIGYGTSYLASKDMKIATVPVGYFHGFSRSLSNHGRVLVNGNRVGVLGTVNMNLCTIDITDVPHTKPGDEVILIGEQGDLSISVASFSEMSDLLNYELLTRLPDNIPRIIV